MQIFAPSLIKKSVQLLAITALFTTSSLYAASMTVKVKNNIQWSEEAAFFATNKGNISVYTVDLTPKQYQNLKSVKKVIAFRSLPKTKSLKTMEGLPPSWNFRMPRK